MVSFKKSVALLKNALAQPVVTHMISVGVITLFVKALAFYKEILVASNYGLSELLDTFYIAILIPSFVQNVFVTSLKNLFIPNYLAEIKDSGETGNFQAISFLIVTIIVIILSFLVVIFSEFFLETVFSGHDASFYELIRKQLYIILPCLILWGYGSLIGGLLEIENKFTITSLSPVFATIVTIICLLFFQETLKEMVLAVGILIGTILSFLYVLYFSMRDKILIIGKLVINENVRMMIHQLPPKITSGFLTGVNPFVDQFFAVQLVVGSVTAINYGIKVPQFVSGIVIIALANVLLPYFSKLISKDVDKAFKQLFKILKAIFFTASLVVILSVFFSEEIIAILFERDEFTAEDTEVVSRLQQIVLIYLPFYLCTLVMVQFLTSINKNSFMAYVSLWNLVLNLLLNIIFMEEFGVYGLVLSTTVVYIICSLVYLKFTLREYKRQNVISK